MRATTTNAGQVLSIGLFFSLMIVGLAASLPQSMEAGLLAQHVPQAVAHQIANMPPVASLFAAFLGYNPMGELIPPAALAALPPANAAIITGKQFFPDLLSIPFMSGGIGRDQQAYMHQAAKDFNLRFEFSERSVVLDKGRIVYDGASAALRDDPHLRDGLNVHRGRLTNRAVAESLGLPFSPPEGAIAA